MQDTRGTALPGEHQTALDPIPSGTRNKAVRLTDQHEYLVVVPQEHRLVPVRDKWQHHLLQRDQGHDGKVACLHRALGCKSSVLVG